MANQNEQKEIMNRNITTMKFIFIILPARSRADPAAPKGRSLAMQRKLQKRDPVKKIVELSQHVEA